MIASKKGLIKKSLILGAAVLAFGPTFAFAEALDGTQWKLQEKGMRFWSTDKLKFDDSQVVSENKTDDGFSPAAYSGSKSDERVTWNASQNNSKGERVEWSGVSMGERMDGTYTITKTDGETVTRQWSAKMVTP